MKGELHLLLSPGIANMERTSSIRRKTIARQHKTEVMIAGEQLRYGGKMGGREYIMWVYGSDKVQNPSMT